MFHLRSRFGGDEEAERRRRELQAGIDFARTQIGRNVWVNPRGGRFGDHYKVLEPAYPLDGLAGVEATVHAGVEKQKQVVPVNLTFAQYMALAQEYRDWATWVKQRNARRWHEN